MSFGSENSKLASPNVVSARSVPNEFDETKEKEETELEGPVPQTNESEKKSTCDFTVISPAGETPENLPTKPQVWLKMFDSDKSDKSVFYLDEKTNSLEIVVQTVDRLQHRKTQKQSLMRYSGSGVIKNSNQEATFASVASNLAWIALNQQSVVIACLGPEKSGKSYTLFGPADHGYNERGMVQRVMHELFMYLRDEEENQNESIQSLDIHSANKTEATGTYQEMEYENSEIKLGCSKRKHIIFSMVEIRRDKVYDLVTLSPRPISIVDDKASGVFKQEITCLDQGLGLYLRGMIGQRLVHGRTPPLHHTITCLEIKNHDLYNPSKNWTSKITFVEIASLPNRSTDYIFELPDPPPKADPCNFSSVINQPIIPKEKFVISKKDDNEVDCAGCGKLADVISVRRDLFNLEEMFIRSHQFRRLRGYYMRLEKMGLAMLMEKPKSHQMSRFSSKLASFLSDIVSENAHVKLILHLRPEKKFLHPTLEAMRFAERAKCIPAPEITHNITSRPFPKQAVASNLTIGTFIDSTFVEVSSQSPIASSKMGVVHYEKPKETLSDVSIIHLTPTKLRIIQRQAEAFFEDKLAGVETLDRNQAKEVFEHFIKMWNDFIDQETLRRNEGEEMAHAGETTGPEQIKKYLQQKNKIRKKKNVSRGKPKNNPETTDLDNLNVNEQVENKSKKQGKSRDKKSKKVKTPQSSDKEPTKKAKETETKDADNVSGKDNRASLSDTMELASTDATTETITLPPLSGAENYNTISPNESRLQNRSKSDTIIRNLSASEGVPTVGGIAENAQDTTKLEFEVDRDGFNKAMETPIPSRKLALEEFLASELGHRINEEVNEHENKLKENATKNGELLIKMSELLSRVNRYQAELDVLQQERHLSGDQYDEAGNVILSEGEKKIIKTLRSLQVSRDAMIDELSFSRSEFHNEKQTIEQLKKDMDTEFTKFCLANYATVFKSDEEVPLCSELNSTPDKEDKEVVPISPPKLPKIQLSSEEKHYNKLKRVATKQAYNLLRSYPRKPQWIQY